MKNLLLTTLAIAATQAVPARAEEAPHLSIRLKPVALDAAAGTGELDVEMRLSGTSAPGGSDLIVHQPGGPRMTKGITIADLRLSDAEGAVETRRVMKDGWEFWQPARAVGGDISLRYRTQIDNSAGGILSSIPYVDGPGLSGIGSMLLALPRLPGDFDIDVRWDLTALPAGATGVTTHADGDFSLAAGPISRLDHTLFMAGLIKSEPRDGSSGFKAIWTGSPQFDLAGAMQWSAALYRFNSRFFADPAEPRYRIFLRENPFNPSNGTATIHAFAMGYGKDTTAEKMKTILGHEMTHTWTANELGKWYTEGNAVYYQARLPWSAGLIPTDRYLDDINLTAARYFTSEVIHAPDADVLPNFWEDLRYNVLSYDRGAMYFAVLNGEIRHASGGTRSVDDLIRAMVAMQRDDGKMPTEADWVALVEKELGAKGVSLHRGMISGENLMVPRSDAFGPCFRRVKAKVRRYDLGFGGPQLKRFAVVEKLRPGSAAAKAGLRNGDRIEYRDSTEGTLRHPDMKLHLKVTRGDKIFETSYLPRGTPVAIYQWARAPAANCPAVLPQGEPHDAAS
ncbi:hypothetical protein [Sphingopyxis sp.]|uniref:hypothetical protein n=1 Tax=Sphingopyxis sp. TaxID=1908224 RepID=UPI002EDB5DAF